MVITPVREGDDSVMEFWSARQHEVRRQLETQLADINRMIDDDVASLGELQEQLTKAVAAATHKAVEGDSPSH